MKPTLSATIAIATVNGVAYTGQPIHLADTLTFTTTIPKLKGGAHPGIVVSAFQDVGGVGTVDTSGTGPDQVWGVLGSPSEAYLLGGGSSVWLQRGGPATCRADLYAYDTHGAETITFLATTGDFPVQA